MLTVLIERCHWVDKCVELTILSFKSHLPDKHMRQSKNLNNLQAISRKDFRRRTQLRMSRQKGDRCLWRNWVDDSLKMLHNVRIAWGQSWLKVHFGNGLIEYEIRLISKASRSLSQIECCWSEHGTSIRFHKKYQDYLNFNTNTLWAMRKPFLHSPLLRCPSSSLLYIAVLE